MLKSATLASLLTFLSRLLKKVDFTNYKSDQNHRDAEVIRRYAVSKPTDYTKYNRICGSLRYVGDGKPNERTKHSADSVSLFFHQKKKLCKYI